jgi:hypothetical protein
MSKHQTSQTEGHFRKLVNFPKFDISHRKEAKGTRKLTQHVRPGKNCEGYWGNW